MSLCPWGYACPSFLPEQFSHMKMIELYLMSARFLSKANVPCLTDVMCGLQGVSALSVVAQREEGTVNYGVIPSTNTGQEWLKSSVMEKDLGLSVDKKLSMNQQCAVATQETNHVPSCIEGSVTAE